jgi:arylsulfatase A-like enzyme
MYPPEKIKFPPNVPADSQTDAVRKEAQGYYAHTTALDKCIGDLVATLAEAGLKENTILIFTSDHGEMMGSHGIRPYTKQVPWAESSHVPFLLRYPPAHGNKGRVVSTPLTTPDIMPTLLGLAGVAIPKPVEGIDLSGLVRTGKELPDRAALYMGVSPFAGKTVNTPYRAICTSRHTYIKNLEGAWLLFDDEKDPYQLDNLVNKPECLALKAKLDAQLQAELKRIGDDFRAGSYYVEKFGYEVAPHGSVSYAPGARSQSPRR